MGYMKMEVMMTGLKELVKEVSNLIRVQNNQSELLTGLMNKGLVFEKKISKFGPTSGAMYFPRRLIGQHFRVLLIPVEDIYEDPLVQKHDSINYHKEPETDPDKLSPVITKKEGRDERNDEIRKRLV